MPSAAVPFSEAARSGVVTAAATAQSERMAAARSGGLSGSTGT